MSEATKIIMLVIGGYILFAIVAAFFAASSDKELYNDGVCSRCNGTWRHFNTDSQGGRGYICDRCGDVIWISYPVDKKKGEKNG